MAEKPPEPEEDREKRRRQFSGRVERKERRKIEARRREGQGIWFGLGMMGIVGWSVAIPAVIGALIGQWVDRTWPSSVSWTLMLLFVGVVTGAATAWFWVKKESSDE
jgi:ATP synthase protein I